MALAGLRGLLRRLWWFLGMRPLSRQPWKVRQGRRCLPPEDRENLAESSRESIDAFAFFPVFVLVDVCSMKGNGINRTTKSSLSRYHCSMGRTLTIMNRWLLTQHPSTLPTMSIITAALPKMVKYIIDVDRFNPNFEFITSIF